MSLGVSGNYYGAGNGVDGYTGKFIPEIWSGKLQVKFYATTVLSDITNNDWEGEIKDQGDKVEIRTVPTITISNYTKGQTLSTQVPSADKIELLIDKGKYFQVVVDDVDDVQSDLKLMDMFTNDASQQMKITIDTDVLSGMVGAAASTNRGNAAGAISGGLDLGQSIDDATAGEQRDAKKVTSANALDYILRMGQALDEANAPEDGRWLVIPAWMAAKIKNSDLKQAYLTGDSMSPIRNGKIGMIDRFTVYTSNLLPSINAIPGEGGDTSVRGYSVFAGTRDAVTFASQVTKMESLRSTATFGNLVRGLNVYGYKVTKPEALVEGFFYQGT